jgi:uroporphyrinogen decarboxylase
MNKRERLQAALNGEPVDRPPVALWRHFPVDDQRPEDLAAAVLEWQALYDWDLVKVTPESGYSVKGWGLRDEWRGEPEGTRQATGPVIQRPEEWLNLEPLEPDAPAGTLSHSLRALELIRDRLQGQTPFLQTIFSPLSQARKLVGPENLAAHVRLYPDEVRFALGVITETTLRYIEAAQRTGIDGIFYALQFASARVFSRAEYREFGEPYDRQILEATSRLWLNIAHLHGDDVLFDIVSHYPIQVINWHDTETPPTLAEGQAQFGGVVCGGLRQWETMVRGTPEQVRAEARAAIAATDGRRFILGTGCVTPTTAPRANLRAARDLPGF